MAFFNIREWIDRISQHPNRRTLTNVEDPTDVKTYDLSRAEGTVTTQGTALTAANLNDLENRIGSAFTAVENAMPEANPAETATGSLTKLKVDGTVYEVEGGGGTTIEKITKAEWDAMTAEEREAFIGVVEDTNADYVPLTADNIPYDSENSIAEKVNKLTVKLTLAEYNALTEKAPNTRYILTDAPALEYTAEDLSYDGGTETVWDKVEELDTNKANANDVYTKTQIDSVSTAVINTTYATGKLYYKRIGKMVIVFGLVTLTANVAVGNQIFSGLPVNNNGANNVIKAINNDGTSADWVIYCGNNNNVYLSAMTQSSGKSYTISFAYYTNA